MLNNLSKNKRLILTLPLVLAAALFVPSHVVPSARGQFTGLVCVTATTTATSCPTSAPSLGPFTVGQTFTIGIFVQGSDAMGGWDIYLKSDPAFVNPTSAAIGALVANPSLTSICINGAAVTGSCTVGTANGPGVVEATTIESTGNNECGGISPCSGMALTITYTVVAATSSTNLSYPTAAGCSASSVSSPPNVCVEIADNGGTILPENTQGATVQTTSPNAVLCVTYPASMPCSVMVGPVTRGSTFVVGIRLQNSQPFGGYDVFASVDTNYLNPTNVTLGTAITNPSLTTICMNGISFIGTCSTFGNGPGIVEVSTVEANGVNDPGTGTLFTITYVVLHKVPTTPVHIAPICTNVVSLTTCSFIGDATGTALTESASDGLVAQNVFLDPTSGVLSCAPNPIVVGNPTTCTTTISDTNTTDPSDSIRQVEFTTTGVGTFSSFTCTLQQIATTSTSNCLTTYTPMAAGSHQLGCIYPGDSAHNGANCPTFNLNALKANITTSSGVIVDQTGLPVPSTGVPVGLAVHDLATLNGGFPVTGVTGTVAYTFYPNGLCTVGTGKVVSTAIVGPSDNVLGSMPVTTNTTGTFSFSATYSGDGNNNAVSSACEPFSVIPTVSFTGGKLHWTHHLSLSKTGNIQSWTAIVTNPLTSAARVLIRIVGTSATNPSLNFDIICGMTCVSTNSAGVNFTPGLTPVTVAAGTSSFSFSFSQTVNSASAGIKFAFTATVYWTTGTLYTASGQKTGSFAVVA